MRMARELPLPLVLRPATDWAFLRKANVGLLIVLAVATTALCLLFLANLKTAGAEMYLCLQAIAATSTAAVIAHACLTQTVRRGLFFVALALAMSLAAEYTGTRWHLPFGYPYVYDPHVQPRICNNLPLCVPLGWMVLAYAPVVFLRRMAVRLRGRISSARLLGKVGLCSLYLMAADLYLDPMCISVGTWTWPEGGAYFGVPVLNFVGWFVVGVTIYLPYFSLTRDETETCRPLALDAGFVVASAGLTILCLAACAWRLGIWLPVPLAGAVMAPVWVYWLAGVARRRACPRSLSRIALQRLKVEGA